jgi:hypothetical protein
MPNQASIAEREFFPIVDEHEAIAAPLTSPAIVREATRECSALLNWLRSGATAHGWPTQIFGTSGDDSLGRSNQTLPPRC